MEKPKVRNSNNHYHRKSLNEKKVASKNSNQFLPIYFAASNGHDLRFPNSHQFSIVSQQQQLQQQQQQQQQIQQQQQQQPQQYQYQQYQQPQLPPHQSQQLLSQTNTCNGCCYHQRQFILSTSMLVPYHSNQFNQSFGRKSFEYDSNSQNRSSWSINSSNPSDYHEEKNLRNDKRSYPSKQRHFVNSSYQSKKHSSNERNVNFNRKKQKNIQIETVDRLYQRFIENFGIETSKDFPKTLRLGCPTHRISSGIWSMFKDNQQPKETYEKKMNIWRDMYRDMKNLFNRFGLFVVGSTLSGFGLSDSDIDMCVMVRNHSFDPRFEELYNLNRIKDYLEKIDYIENIMLIAAKVPILRFRDTRYNLQVDLNCNNIVGIRNTHLLRAYGTLDWRVQPLVITVKSWARNKNINDAKNMTLSSYTLTLMVIHFLQTGVEPPVLPCLQSMYPSRFAKDNDIHDIDIFEALEKFQSKNTMSLGDLLLNFFNYYANFDFKNYAISIRVGKLLPLHECIENFINTRSDQYQLPFICVEEPFNLGNTAYSVYDCDKFIQILNTFQQSYVTLNECRDIVSIFLPL